MKKLFSIIMIIVLSFSLCSCKNVNDHISIWNKSPFSSDNINIEIKPEYFYDKHEKFTVDENTIGVTVYFSKTHGDWN